MNSLGFNMHSSVFHSIPVIQLPIRDRCVVESHDLLADLYKDANGLTAGHAVLVELEGREMTNLMVALGGVEASGQAVVDSMFDLVTRYFRPVFGFQDSEPFFRAVEQLGDAATVKEVVRLFLVGYLRAQELPLPCLSIFDYRLMVRNPRSARLQVGRLLGSGGFGHVYECGVQALVDGHTQVSNNYALKIVNLQESSRSTGQGNDPDAFLERKMRECLLIRHVQHEGICNYVDHFWILPRDGRPTSMDPAEFTDSKICLLMELVTPHPPPYWPPGRAPPADLFDVAIANVLTIEDIKAGMAQVGKTLLFMHLLMDSSTTPPMLAIVHRDIKPENIVFHWDPETQRVFAKILDFGVSRLIGTTSSQRGTTSVGTHAYCAPEIQPNTSHDHRVDVFSFGMTLAVLIGSEVPFRTAVSGPSFQHKVRGYGSHETPIYCCPLWPGGPQTYHPCDNGAYWNARFQGAPVVPGQFETPGAEAVRGLILGLCDPNPDTRLRLEVALANPWWGEHALTQAQFYAIQQRAGETNALRGAAAGSGV